METALKPASTSAATSDVYECRYDSASTDMALCFVYFNAQQSKRLLMNYLYTLEKMRQAKYPVYALELHYGEPEIVNAIHVKAHKDTDVMFHKEYLCAQLELKVPWRYRKIAFLDSDIVFNNPTWYTETSRLLNTHQIVQPFSECSWLSLSYNEVDMTRRSIVLQKDKPIYDTSYHPGFGWAFQRKWFHDIGFYTFSLTGSGDTLSACAWTGQELPKGYNFPAALRPSYEAYKSRVALARPSLACTPGHVMHLHHGSRKNRNYSNRHNILDGISDIRDVIKRNYFTGVYSFRTKALSERMLNYFMERLDDE